MSSAAPAARTTPAARVPARLRGLLQRYALPALLALLAAALVLVALRSRAAAPQVDFDPASPGETGHKALWLWFAEQGYNVAELAGDPFAIPQPAHLLLLPPAEDLVQPSARQPWTHAEAAAVRAFAQAGGTVVVFEPAAAILRAELELAEAVWVPVAPLAQSQPLLPTSPARWPGGPVGNGLAPARTSPAVTVLATAAGEPTAQVQALGDGWVWQLGTPHTLANGALAETPAELALAAAMLRMVPAGGAVLFDTWHLFGAQDRSAVRSLQEWFYRTAPGRATLLALALGAIWLLLSGRRLGPPLEAPPNLQRREAAEFVRAMAGLKRRAGALEATAAHQRRRLKQEFARSVGLAPGATLGPTAEDDAAFVRLLHHTGVADAAACAQVERLLARLQPLADEAAIVAAAVEIDTLLGRRGAPARSPAGTSAGTSAGEQSSSQPST